MNVHSYKRKDLLPPAYLRSAHVSKETYYKAKERQKRPTNTSIPEVCVSVKRELLMAKETYLYGKRALETIAYLRAEPCQKETYFTPKETY